MKFNSTLILLLLGLAACSRREPAVVTHDHGHAHTAPHGGVLVELGEHAGNLEFKFDEARGVLQAWVLDGHAENFVRLAQAGFDVEAQAGAATHRLRFAAVANPLTGESPGNTATFEAEAAWLGAAKAFDGRVKELTVREVIYRDVPFSFVPHDASRESSH